MRFFPQKSLRSQYALWTFLATGSLIALMLISFAFLAYRMFLNEYKLEMEARMEIMAGTLVSMINNTDYIGMMTQANSLLINHAATGVKILDSNEQPLLQKGSVHGFLLKSPIIKNNERIGTIQVIFSDTPITKKISALILLGLLLALITVPLAAILMWFVTGRQLKDIVTLSQEVQLLGNIDSENITLTGINRKDEIGHLAKALAERNDTIRESKKLEQLLYHAINQSHDSVVITDAEANIEYVNPAFSRITGYSADEAIGQNPKILQSGQHPVKFYDVMWKELLKGKTWKGLIVNKRKNGKEYQEEATITPVRVTKGNIHHYVAMKRDVTQEVVLERKLARAEKMQAIGLLASGVAHDLNNILSGIVGYPELLLLQLPKDSKLRGPIKSIHDSGQRAATVVADLLTVARGAAATRSIHDLNSLIEEYLDSPEFYSLKRHYPNITYQQHYHAKQKFISCSSVHVKKCLMNLVTNAAEAISDSGTIIITVENQCIDNRNRTSHDLTNGNYVVLTVQDTGLGIPEKDLEHIFEPFYTRKVMGKSGTGLGLAVVWNTMQDHGGQVHVKSDTTGTSFQLYFPASSELQEITLEPGDKKITPGNGEHILVVDDEPQLRDIAGRMLETLGYKVDSVCMGELAITFVKTNPVDLLVIDMLMEPGMNGCQTYKEILKLYPNQKAIIASGFSESSEVKTTLKLGANGFIKKPYSLDQLARVVQEALEQPTNN